MARGRVLAKVYWFNRSCQRHHQLAPVLLSGVIYREMERAPEHVAICLDRVVSQHVSPPNRRVSPKSTYPWSLKQSHTACAPHILHPYIYSWVPWDGGGMGFTTLAISCLRSGSEFGVSLLWSKTTQSQCSAMRVFIEDTGYYSTGPTRRYPSNLGIIQPIVQHLSGRVLWSIFKDTHCNVTASPACRKTQ